MKEMKAGERLSTKFLPTGLNSARMSQVEKLDDDDDLEKEGDPYAKKGN